MIDKMLKTLLCADQPTLLRLLPKSLTAFYEDIEITDRYIVAGGSEIAVVAHLDTVHLDKNNENTLFFDQKKRVVWSSVGLGADDRAGVFAILKLLKAGLRPTIILLTDEETGGQGAKALVARHSKNYLNLKYIIELDRHGRDDCVFYKCRNSTFEKYVESFGFKRAWGTFSDISVIAPVWNVAAVNLSIGYFEEHSLAEHLDLNILEKTVAKVAKMLADINNAEHFIYNGEIDYSIYKSKCVMCGEPSREDEVFPIRMPLSHKVEDLCIDCYCSLAKYIDWCNTCNCAYLSYNKGGCPKCSTISKSTQ